MPDNTLGSDLASTAWPANAMPAPNQFAGMPGGAQAMDPNDRDVLIKTIAGEASDQPPLGQAAVAHAILNRVAAGGYGQGIAGVAQAPAAGVNPSRGFHEFSVWNPPGVAESSKITHAITPNDPQYAKIGDIVDKVYSGAIPDPTNGATHYYAPRSMPGHRPPPWAAPLAQQNTVKIGDQLFIGGSQGPGQTLPSQVTGGPMDMGYATS